MHHTMVTANDLDRMKQTVLAWLLSMPSETDLAELGQVLLTRVNPEIYEVVQKFNNEIKKGGPRLTRMVAEWMGYDALADLFWPAANFINSYRQGAGDPAEMANAFRELVCLGACFDEDILNQLFSALLAAQMSDKMFTKFRHRPKMAEDLFFGEHAHVKRLVEQQALAGVEAEWVTDVQPAHVTVLKTTDEVTDHDVHYRVPATLRIFDPIKQLYDIQVEQPKEVERYDIEKKVSIPLDKALNGMQLELTLVDSRNVQHIPERYYLKPEHLQMLQNRGTAVSTRIGKNDEIRFYQEYIQSLPGDFYKIPNESLVSIRVSRASVDVQKITRNVQLTVFV